MMMQLGGEGVFVGSGIFKSGDPAARAAAIVKATTFHDDPDVIAKVSRGLGEAMAGINLDTLQPEQRLAGRGWDAGAAMPPADPPVVGVLALQGDVAEHLRPLGPARARPPSAAPPAAPRPSARP